MTRKQDKEISLIISLANDFISRESNRQTLITITRADIAPKLDKSTIYISVFPDKDEALALDFLKRKRSDLRNFVKEKSRLRVIPMFDFAIDLGEKNRQRIDEISHGGDK